MKKNLSSILLLIFFVGQVNLTWASHFCGEKLVSSELTVNPKTADCCGSEAKIPMDCCEDEITRVDSDDFFKKSELKSQISPEFVLALAFSFAGFDTIEADSHAPAAYFPDIPIPDIQVLHQTFLI